MFIIFVIPIISLKWMEKDTTILNLMYANSSLVALQYWCFPIHHCFWKAYLLDSIRHIVSTTLRKHRTITQLIMICYDFIACYICSKLKWLLLLHWLLKCQQHVEISFFVYKFLSQLYTSHLHVYYAMRIVMWPSQLCYALTHTHP